MTAEEYILKWWKKKTVKQLMEKTELSEGQVRTILRAHDITPISPNDLKASYILDHYETMTAKEIAEHLDVDVSTVNNICKEWGIVCTKESQEKQPESEKPHDPKKTFWSHIRPSEPIGNKSI